MTNLSIYRTAANDRCSATRDTSVLPAALSKALSGSQLPALDSLRAISAFLVVMYHFGQDKSPAGFGVLTFFVISGFLITWLLLKEHETFGNISLRLFYLRRSLRIFPALYCYWLIAVGAALLLHKRIVWPQAISVLFYVNDYYQAIQGHVTGLFGHTWSLGVEEQFYLLWPMGLIFLLRRQKRMAALLALIIGFLWAYRLFLVLVVRVHEVYIYEAFDTRTDHLLIGCLLAILLKEGRVTNLWRVACVWPASAFVTVILIVASVVSASVIGIAYRDTVGFIIDPLLIAMLLTQWMAFAKTAIWGWIQAPILRYLGRISYSVYLYHQLIPSAVTRFTSGAPSVVQLAIHCIEVTALASMSYFLVERPFLKLKGRFATRR
jgi:peptidoglycan/LPS O-acetylase OafA/YrhL